MDVGRNDFNEILCHGRAVGDDSLVTFQRMHNSRRLVAETEPVDAVREIQWHRIEHWADVDVAAGEMNAFAAGDVEVAIDLVQSERAMHTARVERFVGLNCALGQIVSGALAAFVNDILENDILRNER